MRIGGMKLKYYKKRELDSNDAWNNWYCSEEGKSFRAAYIGNKYEYEQMLHDVFVAGFRSSKGEVVIHTKFNEEDRERLRKYIVDNRVCRKK